MQETQILVKKEDLAVYDKVSDKFLQTVCLRSRYFLERHTHHAKFTLAQLTAKNNVDKAFK